MLSERTTLLPGSLHCPYVDKSRNAHDSEAVSVGKVDGEEKGLLRLGKGGGKYDLW